MISPIRNLCFNDDHQTFTILLPSQYRIFKCDPFGMIFSRELEDLSLSNVATYSGYRFLAVTGSLSPPIFNSKCCRIFDHQTGEITFDHTFEDHILTLKLGDGIVVINMYLKVQIWSTTTGTMLQNIEIGHNVHCPLALSPDSNTLISGGANDLKIMFCTNIRDENFSKKQLKLETRAISLIQFSHNSNTFAVCSFYGDSIGIYSCLPFSSFIRLDKKEYDDIVQSLDFSPNLKYVATCSKDGIVRIYDIQKMIGYLTPIPPLVSTTLPSVTMPRLSWITDENIGVISLDGDYYKIQFNGTTLEFETIQFLKRDTQIKSSSF